MRPTARHIVNAVKSLVFVHFKNSLSAVACVIVHVCVSYSFFLSLASVFTHAFGIYVLCGRWLHMFVNVLQLLCLSANYEFNVWIAHRKFYRNQTDRKKEWNNNNINIVIVIIFDNRFLYDVNFASGHLKRQQIAYFRYQRFYYFGFLFNYRLFFRLKIW